MSTVVVDPALRIELLKRQIASHQREQTKLLQKRARAKRATTRIGQKEWTADQQEKLQHLPTLIQRKNLEIMRLIAAMNNSD